MDQRGSKVTVGLQEVLQEIRLKRRSQQRGDTRSSEEERKEGRTVLMKEEKGEKVTKRSLASSLGFRGGLKPQAQRGVPLNQVHTTLPPSQSDKAVWKAVQAPPQHAINVPATAATATAFPQISRSTLMGNSGFGSFNSSQSRTSGSTRTSLSNGSSATSQRSSIADPPRHLGRGFPGANLRYSNSRDFGLRGKFDHDYNYENPHYESQRNTAGKATSPLAALDADPLFSGTRNRSSFGSTRQNTGSDQRDHKNGLRERFAEGEKPVAEGIRGSRNNLSALDQNQRPATNAQESSSTNRERRIFPGKFEPAKFDSEKQKPLKGGGAGPALFNPNYRPRPMDFRAPPSSHLNETPSLPSLFDTCRPKVFAGPLSKWQPGS